MVIESYFWSDSCKFPTYQGEERLPWRFGRLLSFSKFPKLGNSIMTVREIVAEYLKKNRYDGLCLQGCQCTINEIENNPDNCGICDECIPGVIQYDEESGEELIRPVEKGEGQ